MQQEQKDIFQDICDYVKMHDFQLACTEYFGMHAHKFEDTEENKLSYTSVHEGYVYILETVIDAKLKEKHGEAKVEEFYSTFLDNFVEY